MLRLLAVGVVLLNAVVCHAQGSPSAQPPMQQQPGAPQQPGSPQQPGATQPPMQPSASDPNTVPLAPPTFAPGVGGGTDTSSEQPKVVRISGGVMAGNLVSKVDPVYPDDAKAAGMAGSVVLSAHI